MQATKITFPVLTMNTPRGPMTTACLAGAHASGTIVMIIPVIAALAAISGFI